ncbi:RpiB/LacA/LacB family sugar-phosphate isomerase [Spiroplasma endosymbiont of Aspidapion aeneum]|uniref:RpiB/LacA/LacB family sugar-phosphate isomerase n=1 Tax=Spiroplasma endosymbiont of Aspidapion aeneum TaxID=3066276 RepID=UPI00313CCC1E
MKIAIGCDHIVTEIKDHLIKSLEALGYDVIDCGTYDKERTHYPIFGHKVATLVAKKEVEFGVIMCGTGVGISNSANKTKNIRAALVRDVASAVQAREEFNANIIAVGGRVSGEGLIEEIYKAFLETKYIPSKEREDRIKKIDSLIKKENYNDDMFDLECKRWDEGYYHD